MAFLSLQQQVAHYKDTAAFLAILTSRLPRLTDEQASGLLNSFTAGDKREKVFGSKSLSGVEKKQEQRKK
jgi:hypothetical protein